MLNYYITTNKTWANHVSHMADSHFFEHNGEIVLCARFLNGVWHDQFHGEADVLVFPHLLDSKPIGNDIASRLGDFGVLASDTTFETAMKLKKHNPAFDPRVFA